MLNIIFNRGEKDIEDANYVFSPDTYFKYNYEEEWFDDALVKEMVQDVDSSAVMSAYAINSPVLGIIAPERLSGGVKAEYEMEFEEPFEICIKNSGNVIHPHTAKRPRTLCPRPLLMQP